MSERPQGNFVRVVDVRTTIENCHQKLAAATRAEGENPIRLSPYELRHLLAACDEYLRVSEILEEAKPILDKAFRMLIQ